jgi:hypothetical protein
MSPSVSLLRLTPLLLAVYLIVVVAATFAARLFYPFDLEWMEGGMLTHAWRLAHGEQLYVVPSAEFIPFIYPPGYPALLAWLSSWFELDYPLGRSVSIVGTILSTASVFFTIRLASNHRSSWRYGLIGAAVWVGTYGATGAFMDIVRPDSLGVGLLACAIGFSFSKRPWAPLLAGLFIFLAFTVKHNLAAFGLPLLIGLAWRGGRSTAFRFALTSVVPALVFVFWMQVRSEGRFLSYLLGVPSSHPVVGMRVWPGTPWELAEALPVVVALTSLTLMVAVGRHLRDGKHARWWFGMAFFLLALTVTSFERALPLSWLATPDLAKDPLVAHVLHGVLSIGLSPIRTVGSFGPWISGLGVAAVALLLGAVASMIRIAWTDREALSWQVVMLAGLALTGLVLVALMRGHHGGFINVFMPMMLILSVGFGVALTRLEMSGLWGLASVLAITQVWMLTWQLAVVHTYPDRTPTALEELVPSAEEVVAGERVVERIAALNGPVLSPIAAWMPVQAGHAPGLHLISLWDINHKSGPFYEEVAAIRRDISSGRIRTVIDGQKSIRFGVQAAYKRAGVFQLQQGELMPKSGWRTRPFAIMVPKESAVGDAPVGGDAPDPSDLIEDALYPGVDPKEQ